MLKTLPVAEGVKVALLSPAWAAPAYYPAVHEQGAKNLAELFNFEIVEYPSTRKMGASALERAEDLNAAFADPQIRAIFTTVGGDDQIRILKYLDPEIVRMDPKPFFGYSDNTNILNWLWLNGVQSYHGGSTMVHLSGPSIDPEHALSLHAALTRTGDLELTIPAVSQDFGFDWSDPSALNDESEYYESLKLKFYGNPGTVTGTTWGGSLEVIDQLALADRLPRVQQLAGAILILETSEIMPPADMVGRWIRGLGERGYFAQAAGMILARPVSMRRDKPESYSVSLARIEAQYDYVLAELSHYVDLSESSDFSLCLGLPFGHTKPQYVLPYGGKVSISAKLEKVIAHFG